MKIIKEDLDNLERVKNRQTVQGIIMKDAEEQSKKSEDNFKEVAGDPQDLKKKKPFISGEKQPKPKDVKTPKPELEESLFEEDIDDANIKGEKKYLMGNTAKATFRSMIKGTNATGMVL